MGATAREISAEDSLIHCGNALSASLAIVNLTVIPKNSQFSRSIADESISGFTIDFLCYRIKSSSTLNVTVFIHPIDLSTMVFIVVYLLWVMQYNIYYTH